MTDTDFIREVSEDLRRDQWTELWDRYGRLVIIAAVGIIASTACIVTYKGWREQQNIKATAVLADALELTRKDDHKAAAQALGKVAVEAEGGTALLAGLYQADETAKANDPKAAAALYDKIAGNDKAPAAFRELATLRSVALQMDDGDAAALQERLKPLTAENSAWRFSARELSGLLALRQNNPAQAASIFRQLAEDFQTPADIKSRAQQLATLPVPAAGPVPAAKSAIVTPSASAQGKKP